jgi:hypothetical protein
VKPNSNSALTLSGVLKKLAEEEPAGKLVAQFIEGLGVLIIIFLLTYLLLLGIANQKAFEFNYRVIPGYKEPTRNELKRAMRYHGIFAAKEEENRKWYFMRDGKRCQLFAYLKNKNV